MSNLQPTPIVDKNGKQTTVHKRTDTASNSGRLDVGIRSAAHSTVDLSVGDLTDGSSYTLNGNAELTEDKGTYTGIGGAQLSKAYFSLKKGDSVRIDIDKDVLGNAPDAHDFSLTERTRDGVTRVFLGYTTDLSNLVKYIPDSVGDTNESKNHVLVGFLYGKYGAQVRKDEYDNDIVLIPTRDQMHGSDEAMEYGTYDFISPYGEYTSTSQQQFGRDLGQGMMKHVIGNAFPDEEAAQRRKAAKSDTIGILANRIGVVTTGTGLTNNNGDDALAIKVKSYADVHHKWEDIKAVNHHVQIRPKKFSAEVREAFQHMASNYPDTKLVDDGELIYWKGLAFPKD
jgi:hypothetical protein